MLVVQSDLHVLKDTFVNFLPGLPHCLDLVMNNSFEVCLPNEVPRYLLAGIYINITTEAFSGDFLLS